MLDLFGPESNSTKQASGLTSVLETDVSAEELSTPVDNSPKSVDKGADVSAEDLFGSSKSSQTKKVESSEELDLF